MPLVDGEELRLVYGCDPTRILDVHARTVHEPTPVESGGSVPRRWSIPPIGRRLARARSRAFLS
jgi:hypothetical protein